MKEVLEGGEEGEEKPFAKFSDACFLMDYIDVIARKGASINTAGFSNFKVVDASPERGGGAHYIISKLTSRTGLQKFIDISPATLTALQPRVRLYKITYPALGVAPPLYQEFIFHDFFNQDGVEAIIGGKSKRIGGVGLKECSWVLDGTNPAEAEKVIKVSMSFEFQSAADLLGARFNPSDGTIRAGTAEEDARANMIDLILHPPKQQDAEGVNARLDASEGKYVPAFYRVKLEIGWAPPNLEDGRLPGLTTEETIDFLAELRKQRMSLILNLVDHTLDIKENGAISLSVEYVGALEETINGNAANILNMIDRAKNTPAAERLEEEMELNRRQIAELEEQIECLNLNNPNGSETAEDLADDIEDLQEDINDFEEDMNEFTSAAKGATYNQFLTKLFETQGIYGFDIDQGDIETWLESVEPGKTRPAFSDVAGDIEKSEVPEAAEAGQEAVEDAAEEAGENPPGSSEGQDGVNDATDDTIKSAKDAAVDPDKGRINFLFLGDILEVACGVMSSIMGNPHLDNMRILTGPVVINHPRGMKIHMNLADLPIPFHDFQQFFFEVVVRKQLSSYPLKQFMKDVMERLVKKVLQPSECFPGDKEGRQINISVNSFPISQATADSVGIGGNSGFGTCDGRLYVDTLSDSDIVPLGEEERPMNCLFFYLNSYKAKELRANEIEDRNKGIYHYYIGLDKGLVKSINFEKSDIQGFREARQAEAGNLGQIRDMYNAKVKMVGNNLYYPGMKLFLNPPIGFGRPEQDATTGGYGTLANLLGIGGYYDVITVDSTISRGGQYETELNCVFAQSGGKRDNVEARCDSVIQSLAAEIAAEKNSGVVGSIRQAVGAEATTSGELDNLNTGG